jgi:hypothetical protein
MNIAYDDQKVIAYDDRKVITLDAQKVVARAIKLAAARCYFKPPLPPVSVIPEGREGFRPVSRRELQNANGR